MKIKYLIVAAAGVLAISGCDIEIDEIDGTTNGGVYAPDVSDECRAAVARTANRDFYETYAGPVEAWIDGFAMQVTLDGTAHWTCYTDYSGNVESVAFNGAG